MFLHDTIIAWRRVQKSAQCQNQSYSYAYKMIKQVCEFRTPVQSYNMSLKVALSLKKVSSTILNLLTLFLRRL